VERSVQTKGATSERLDSSSLTVSDIDKLDAARPVRPTRWHEYVFKDDWENKDKGAVWKEFHPVIPFAIIDSRIISLAISFWEGPDDRLVTGYRRLEDIVRKRTGLDEHGVKLFSQAFESSTAKLEWKGLDSGEQTGRGFLFKAAYMAYRNPRAHREFEAHANDQLAEFLLLNHLFLLEKESVKVVTKRHRKSSQGDKRRDSEIQKVPGIIDCPQ